MLINLMTNNLPWNNYIDLIVGKEASFSVIKKLIEIKSKTPPEELCKGLPEEFSQYIKYCRNLHFKEDPDYDYLRGLFTTILIKNRHNNDLNFSWIIKRLNSKIDRENINKRNNNFLKRMKTSHQRLYSKIKESLEKKNFQIL